MKNNSTHMQDSILIQVPIDVVFNYITDFENTPHWHKNMKKVGWITTPPHGVGSKYDWIESFAGMKMDIGGTITEWKDVYKRQRRHSSASFMFTAMVISLSLYKNCLLYTSRCV